MHYRPPQSNFRGDTSPVSPAGFTPMPRGLLMSSERKEFPDRSVLCMTQQTACWTLQPTDVQRAGKFLVVSKIDNCSICKAHFPGHRDNYVCPKHFFFSNCTISVHLRFCTVYYYCSAWMLMLILRCSETAVRVYSPAHGTWLSW